MSNTGKKRYNDLIEIYTDTGLPTGNAKSNDASDPDYLPPVEDSLTCPPDNIPSQTQNSFQIEFKNSCTQSLFIKNTVINASNLINISDIYFVNEEGFGMLPGKSFLPDPVTQLADLTNVNFTLNRAAKELAVRVVISYKSQNDGDYTVINTTERLLIKTSFEKLLLSTPKLTSGINVNKFRIEFFDNPVPDPTLPTLIVNAGLDQTILSSDLLTLTGTVLDFVAITSVKWSQVSGPNMTIITNFTATTSTVTGFVAGTYIFKLLATSVLGESSSDLVKITVNNAINPNGVIHVWIDPAFPDNTFSIDQMILTPMLGGADITYSSTTNKASGSVAFNPLKGTYRLKVRVNGAINKDRTLSVFWGGGSIFKKLVLPEPNTYVFENVVIDEGNNGLLIQLFANIDANPTGPINFGQLTVQTPINTTTSFLPSGVIQSQVGNVSVNFFNLRTAGVATLTDAIIALNKTTIDHITANTIVERFFISASQVNSLLIDSIQARKTFDYTLAIPLIEDKTFNWQLVSGEGYLV